MVKTTISQVASWLNCPVFNLDKTSLDQRVEGVCIDSRKVAPDCIYIPIIGQRVDGHDYAHQAYQQGARLIFWQKDHLPYPVDFPILVVDDTQQALAEFAKAYLASLSCITIGITGSNGKTSTKDFLDGMLSQLGKSHKTKGNMNNEIGLPLTILDLEEDTQFNILEMGMENFGEIAELCKIAPLDFAIITSIGSAHMENLGDKFGIAKAKLEIAEGLKPEGTLVYCDDSLELQEVLKEIPLSQTIKTISYGKSGQVRFIEEIEQKKDGIEFVCSLWPEKLFVPVAGSFQGMNALGACIVAASLGATYEQIQKGLKQAKLTPMRGAIHLYGKAMILDDTYKSNPESARAALDMLMSMEGAKHVAVVADMLDLGKQEEQLHYEIGQYAKKIGVDVLYAYGEKSQATAKGFGQGSYSYETQATLIEDLKKYKQESAVLMIKGSRALKMDQVVSSLLEDSE